MPAPKHPGAIKAAEADMKTSEAILVRLNEFGVLRMPPHKRDTIWRGLAAIIAKHCPTQAQAAEAGYREGWLQGATGFAVRGVTVQEAAWYQHWLRSKARAALAPPRDFPTFESLESDPAAKGRFIATYGPAAFEELKRQWAAALAATAEGTKEGEQG